MQSTFLVLPQPLEGRRMRTFGGTVSQVQDVPTHPLQPPTPQSTIVSPLGRWQGLAFRSCLILQVPGT